MSILRAISGKTELFASNMAEEGFEFKGRAQQFSPAELDEVLRVAPPLEAMLRVRAMWSQIKNLTAEYEAEAS